MINIIVFLCQSIVNIFLIACLTHLSIYFDNFWIMLFLIFMLRYSVNSGTTNNYNTSVNTKKEDNLDD